MDEISDFNSLSFILLPTDGPPVIVRRTLQRVIAAEQAAAGLNVAGIRARP
jgi:hypothetical protein